jgi:hypothetical protein
VAQHHLVKDINEQECSPVRKADNAENNNPLKPEFVIDS